MYAKALKPFEFMIFVIYAVTAVSFFLTSCTERNVAANSGIKPFAISENAVNINSATASELAKIRHIGPKLAGEIVEFRTRHGPFRRTEHLMLIRGIGDNRYREIKAYVKTE